MSKLNFKTDLPKLNDRKRPLLVLNVDKKRQKKIDTENTVAVNTLPEIQHVDQSNGNQNIHSMQPVQFILPPNQNFYTPNQINPQQMPNNPIFFALNQNPLVQLPTIINQQYVNTPNGPQLCAILTNGMMNQNQVVNSFGNQFFNTPNGPQIFQILNTPGMPQNINNFQNSHINNSAPVSKEDTSSAKTRKKRVSCDCPNCTNSVGKGDPNHKKSHICHYVGCNKVYGKTSHLRAHLRWHTGERPFVCDWKDCIMRFTRSDELQRHRRTHTGEKKFVCAECSKRMSKKNNEITKPTNIVKRKRPLLVLNVDAKKKKIDIDPPIITENIFNAKPETVKSIIDPTNLNPVQPFQFIFPINQNFYPQNNPYRMPTNTVLMPVGPNQFVQMPVLNQHFFINMQNTPQIFPSMVPTNQMINTFGNQFVPFNRQIINSPQVCSIVNNNIMNQSNQTSIHSVKTDSQKNCFQQLKYQETKMDVIKPNLVSESNLQVTRTRQKRISCECPNCMNPNPKKDPNQKKTHICHYEGCRKEYGKSSHLRAHIRWHTGERPFVCDWKDCIMKFTRSDELQRHRRTHTGEKKFTCPECPKKFIRSDHLKKHMKVHLKKTKMQANKFQNLAPKLNLSCN
ncbi:hypothetical protein A3Q56_00821 [Intoshia linei]|uniref:C2H2-type domain-containing protein n=1 Tax=Intoshia linei TaxID=1819745 RepID=A0A177BB45_9BILA|nr:hypothetical protein A3Q56_00821 [Intoshia linei]